MKTVVTESDFRDAFRAMGRNDQFSYEGLGQLFEYIERYEEDTGTEWELDVIALCCEYYEATWQEIADDYSIELTDPEDEDLVEREVSEYLEFHTTIVGRVTGGCVYMAF